MKKKIFAVCISVILIAASFAGCKTEEKASTSGDESESKSTSSTASTGEAVSGKTYDVSWASWTLGPVDKDNYAENKLKEFFPDINFDFWGFERPTWADQINTRVIGGDVPDVIYRDSSGMVKEYAEQDILAEVPYSMIREHAPNIYAAIQEFGEDVWLATYYNGKNYGIPIMQPNQTRPFTDAWRMDWLEKVGITKVPETLEEMHEAGLKFATEDPDENGQNDTYLLTTNAKQNLTEQASFQTVFGAYGVFLNCWILQDDGTMAFGPTTKEAKQALGTLAQWYSEGLIDPEFVTSDNTAVKEKWYNGNLGYMSSQWYRNIPGGEHYEGLLAVNPDAKIAQAPAVKGPEGEHGYVNWGSITSSFTFSKDLEDDLEKLIRIIQVFDKIYSEEEIFVAMRFGEEGTHWQRDPEHNQILPIEPYGDVARCGPIGNNMFNPLNPNPNIATTFARNDEPELYKYAIDTTIVNGEDYFRWVEFFMDDESRSNQKTVNSILDRGLIDIIVGTRPVDDFDSVVEEWKQGGGEALTVAYNEAYSNGMERLESIVADSKV